MKNIKIIKALDALRLKKYYSYYIKMNRKNSVKDIRNNIMAPLDHTFDDHNICVSKRCYKKCIEEDDMILVDRKAERIKIGHCRYKIKDNDLYDKLCKKYEFYTMEEKIT